MTSLRLAPAVEAKRSLAGSGFASTAEQSQPLTSAELLVGARVRAIEHDGERYYLRVTRKGKLILNK